MADDILHLLQKSQYTVHRAQFVLQVRGHGGFTITETSCAITAASQFSPAVDFADLDGSLLIANDRFKGMEVVKGKITLPDLPGIGVVKL